MADGELFIGLGFDSGERDGPQGIRLDKANRHGLITGATGTGKTVTLQTIAEGFANAGVPVFAADIKGDLSGISQAGVASEKLLARAQSMGLNWGGKSNAAIFWDLYGEKGSPIRTTISEMGPVLLSRLLELEDAQAGLMDIVFQLADEQQLLLLDLDDLQAMIIECGQNAKDISLKYGNVAPATVGAVQRKILSLRTQGGAHLFGEPALRLEDLMRSAIDGRGYVSVLAADKLISSPQLYATFLLWLMSELFEVLPEVGDQPKPRLVFFFDEAHLLFTDAPKSLLQKIEQVVRLIRSKGVSIWFITQSPTDIPETVLAQLGTRVQHALRAYTPNEQAALQLASRSFRANAAFDTAEAIQSLGVGEALVSTLDEKGAPTMVARTRIAPPQSRIGPATPDERNAAIAASPVTASYATAVNRESAYEKLQARAGEKATEAAATEQAAADAKAAAAQAKADAAAQKAAAPRASSRQTVGEAVQMTAARTLTTTAIRTAGKFLGSRDGQKLIRGVLGSLLGGGGRR
jgi:DNA helicase HerA-like ATPase